MPVRQGIKTALLSLTQTFLGLDFILYSLTGSDIKKKAFLNLFLLIHPRITIYNYHFTDVIVFIIKAMLISPILSFKKKFSKRRSALR